MAWPQGDDGAGVCARSIAIAGAGDVSGASGRANVNSTCCETNAHTPSPDTNSSKDPNDPGDAEGNGDSVDDFGHVIVVEWDLASRVVAALMWAFVALVVLVVFMIAVYGAALLVMWVHTTILVY